jgi:uncharacterized protein YjdB
LRIDRCLFVIAVLLSATALRAQNTITTDAGGGNPNGLAATAADIVTPSGVAADNQGNVYIGQFLGSQVFKVNPQGIVSVFAGQNFIGFSGDGGPAAKAGFSATLRLALDTNRNLFVAEYAGARVRRIDAQSGVITTVAGNGIQCATGPSPACGDGGLATQANLNSPEGIALDISGDLFIADHFAARVRRVDALTGIITTVAGSGAVCTTVAGCGDGGLATQALLHAPRDVAVDATGNLFIADGQEIRRVDASTKIITTIATPPDTVNFLYLEPSGNMVATGNATVYRVNGSTFAVTTIAGNSICSVANSGDGGPAASACLGGPFSVSEDTGGNIYVGQSGSNRVRKIDNTAQHIITTFAGGGSGGDSGADVNAILAFPGGGALDSLGNGFIVDAANNRIRRVGANTNVITTAAGTGEPGTAGDNGPATSATLSLVPAAGNTGFVIDSSGNMYFPDDGGNSVRRVSSSGTISTIAGGGTLFCNNPTAACGDGGPATAASFNLIQGLGIDTSNNLYIGDSNDSRVRRISAATGIISTVAGNGTACANPTSPCGDGGLATAANLNCCNSLGLGVDPHGNLFIADGGDFRVRRVDSVTGIISTVAGNGTACANLTTPCGEGGLATAAELYLPIALTFDQAGDLFIADGNRVRRVDAISKTITTVAGNATGGFSGDGGPALAAGLNSPAALWVDAGQHLFIADAANNRIRDVALSPAAMLTGTIANFGSQLVGVQSPAHTVTITNSGSATLTVASITLTGTGFTTTNTCTNTNNQLAPSQSCTVSVTFNAPASGPFPGNLSISTNDPTAATATFSFGGTGSTSALVSIALSPLNSSIIQGLPQQFTATATYADASTQDLTNTAAWTTASSAIATITNAGVATGVAPGTTAVQASSGSITASTNLTVTAPTLLVIELTPATSFIIVGQTEQFKALAIFNNGSQQILTSSVTWTSSSPANATVTSSGLATGVALGNATITATDGSISATAALTVTPAGFTLTGNLNVAREFHTATLLNNGKVLIAGGEDTQDNLLDSAELYDPATGTFSFTGSMNLPRVFQSAVLLNNGKVLIVGGAETGTGQAELYDPATGTFSFTGSTTDTFILAGTATLLKNGKVLVLGGEGATGFLADAELYDPVTGLFSATGSLTAAREFPTSTLLQNGQVLVVGGQNSSGPVPTAELYNPATGTFTLTTGNPITAQSFFLEGSGTLLNTGMVLLPSDVASSALELYNPATETFSSTGTSSTGVFFFDDVATLLSNGTVLLAGGDTGTDFTAAEIYDPTSATTAPTGQLNVGRVFSTATLLNNGKVLVTGGENLTGLVVQSGAELYTPSSLTPANLISIAMTPALPTIAVGAAEQFVATGTFVGNTTQILSAANWTSSVPTVASVTNGTGTGGAAFGLTAGSAIITACAGTACGSTTLTVGSSATLTSITVTPANPTITKGSTEQFTATGHFSDGSSSTLTGVTWSSGTPVVASISTAGLATALTIGTSTITATSGNIHGSTVLTVSAPTLASIAVTPASPSITVGTTQQFTATGTFSDGSTENLTSTVTWTSATPATATITAAGLATGVATGTSVIKAAQGAIFGSTTLTVAAPTLVSIAVTPVNPSIAVGATLQFTATGTFSNSTTQNLTGSVTWSSGTTPTATINAAGLATAVAAGTSTVKATSGSISGSTLLTVSAPTLVSIAVTPVNPSIAVGATLQFTATGTFSNGTMQNLTSSVTWSSATPATASITTTGLAQGLAIGTTSIRATINTISGATLLTVSAPPLVSIAVTPANPVILVGATQQFVATGTFSDASTRNITNNVGWASTVHPTATIDSAGLATAVGAGSTTISAISGAITGSTSLTVTTAGTPEPAIGLNPGSLTFPSQLITTSSAAQTITVSNLGTAVLTINSIALTGTNPAEFKETNTCPVPPSVLPAGQTCTVQVSFVPLAIGTRTANVTFTDNNGGISGSIQNIPVSGSATAPAPITTTTQLSYPVGTNVSQTATINCPSNTVPCTDPNAHSLKLVVSQVLTPFTLTVTSFEVPLSQANGVCPAGATETTDFDCRFKSTFTLQTEPNGDVIVPQCIPFSNGNCVFYRVSDVPPQSSYVGPVFENFSWNNNAFVPSSFYSANNPRLFDDPDAPPFDVNHQFVFDITDFFESNGNKVGVDPTIHGHTKQYNDFVVAFTAALPNPALTLTFQPPLGSGSPSFTQGATIPVAFTLFQVTNPITDAVTSPNAVSIGLANASGTRFAALAPDGTAAAFTFNPTAGQYVLTLATQNLPPGAYTLLVNSNLFVQQTTSFTIAAAPLVITSTSPLTAGTTGIAYSQTLAATGGTPPLAWSVSTGTPPSGLNLSAVGVLAGIPSAAVTGDIFTVQVKDSVGVTSTKQFVLAIAQPSLVSIAVTPANPSIVIAGAQQFTATGTFSNGSTQNLTGSVTWSSATPAAATIATTGLATGLAAGTSVIRATSGNISGTTTLAVTTAVTPEPLIFFKPTSLSFANQLIGSSSALQTFTVGNTGTAPLTITAIALTGTNPAEYKESNNCPIGIGTALAVGATCNVQVSFVPLAVDTRTANVTFTDNSGGIVGSQQNVSLSGTASAPPPITTTVQLSYPVGTNVSQVATINCPSNTVPCTDPNAHSLKLVVSQVLTPFTLTVTSFEVPLSQANGVCPSGATETTDFDCRFKSTFTLQTEPNGDVIVPQCIPFSNGNCVFYRVSDVPPQSSYVGPVFENFSWNNNAFVPSSFYAANNPRLFDDPDAPPFDVNHQFVFDITDFFESNGNKVGVDPTIHGHTKQYNDFVVAFTAALPSPPLTLTFQPPLGTGSPNFTQGATIPVAFSLTQGATVITNAITSPNAVSIGLANASGSRFAALAPDGTPAAFTFNTTSQQYGLTLATQALPPGVYTLFVNSNLFVQQSTTFTITAPPPVVTITPAANPFTVTKGTGTYVVALTVVNTGNVPVGTLSLTKATLGGQAALSFSGPDSNVLPGASAIFTLTFPSTAVADGKGVPLTVNGTYLAGALSGTWTAGFRSVTLP